MWRGAETDNESDDHCIVIAENVSLKEFLKKVPERGIGCKIALRVIPILQFITLLCFLNLVLARQGHHLRVPSRAVQAEVCGILVSFNHSVANDTCYACGSVTLALGPNTARAPDAALQVFRNNLLGKA